MRIITKSFTLFVSFDFFLSYFVFGWFFYFLQKKTQNTHTRTKSINIQLIFCTVDPFVGKVKFIWCHILLSFLSVSSHNLVFVYSNSFRFFSPLQVNPFEMNHIFFRFRFFFSSRFFTHALETKGYWFFCFVWIYFSVVCDHFSFVVLAKEENEMLNSFWHVPCQSVVVVVVVVGLCAICNANQFSVSTKYWLTYHLWSQCQTNKTTIKEYRNKAPKLDTMSLDLLLIALMSFPFRSHLFLCLCAADVVAVDRYRIAAVDVAV